MTVSMFSTWQATLAELPVRTKQEKTDASSGQPELLLPVLQRYRSTLKLPQLVEIAASQKHLSLVKIPLATGINNLQQTI